MAFAFGGAAGTRLGRPASTLLWFALSLLIATPAAPPAIAAPAAPGPSFSCAKPSEIEAIICGDRELSAADRRLTALYAIAKPGALGGGSNQLAAQRDWLKERDKSCAGGLSAKARRDCLVTEYDERLEQLAIADLLVDPEDSLAELGRIRPRTLPLYRAIYHYTSIDDGKRRAEVVEADLAPIYASMDDNTRKHLSSQFDQDLANASQAAASDVNFATFFAIYATLGLDSDTVTWPCAALVKRPGLIVGLGSQFGGAIDGSIPGSDCDTTLPPIDEVSELSEEALRAQPASQGTIRFSVGRDYSQLLDAVRLHLTDFWRSKTSDNGPSTPGMPPEERVWRIRHEARINKAEAVLEAYYARSFGATPKAANKDAWSAIDVLIDEAFTSYD
jgi:uncharacterized protein